MSAAINPALPLIACLIATVIPVFFGKLSVTPTWLSLQALALGWITLNQHQTLDIHALEAGLEILIIRAWLVPYLLRRTLQGEVAAELDVMPSNLFAWGAALGLIILAFQFGAGARADVRALTLGVAAATVMVAFMVLATNRESVAQLVALLFMENALALFETLMPEPWPLPVHIAVSAVYVGTVSVGSWLIRGQSVSNALVSQPKENGQ
jgi:hydrogenase-4 membrane subunit HyfE